MRPFFFVFDGVDGAGKTTQIRHFQAWMESAGYRVTLCRDPGTTPLGEQIRELLLSSSQLAINLAAEMFLYMAARAQLVEDVVRPALDRGECVISDRYLLANVVYQGYAGGLDVDALWRIGTLATGGVQPDLTFVLDLDPSMAASRRNSPPDRLERRGLAYFERVRAGFLAEAVRQPHAIAVVDASRDPHSVEHEIRRLAEPIVQKELPG